MPENSVVQQKFSYFGVIAIILIVTVALCWGLTTFRQTACALRYNGHALLLEAPCVAAISLRAKARSPARLW
jgi:hypothetical protein